ncbi:MAG: crossover junction endodeoxyribonuclease RuvC [Nitriliruptorales bacterium]|nr:crossover junction endodeoxyribonuclease RuvC [Nitriliruptorales bacterium]
MSDDHPVRQRVLGIDPGLTRCGVGVLDGPAHRPRVVAATCLRTDASRPTAERLLELQQQLEALIDEHAPTAVACERVLFSNNVRTAMATGQALGVALVAAARAGVAVVEYSPTDVKLTVAGHGGAGKDAVGRMTAAQLRLDETPRPADVADALAVALCHLGRSRPGSPVPTAGRRGGDWSAVLDNPHVRVAGGTAPMKDPTAGGTP